MTCLFILICERPLFLPHLLWKQRGLWKKIGNHKGFWLIQGKIPKMSWSVLDVTWLYIWTAFGHVLAWFLRGSSKEKRERDKKKWHWQQWHVWQLMYLSLSKNYLTRSSSWDEHISFSRVSWPTNRQQVNASSQSEFSHTSRMLHRQTQLGFLLLNPPVKDKHPYSWDFNSSYFF